VLQQIVGRFALVVCPLPSRTDGVLREFGQLRAALPPATRRLLGVAFIVVDQGARLYPRSFGRRFVRLPSGVADRYVRRLMGLPGAGVMVQRLRSLIVMCYYELPESKQEIGYLPDPYIASVTRRRLELYGAEIQAHEAHEAHEAGE
jgi:hypothetical protein